MPCIVADDLTPEQIKAFRIADNKTGELAEWDFAKLEKEILSITSDMSKFGFNMSDFEYNFNESNESEQGDLGTIDAKQEKTIICENCGYENEI